MNGDNSAINGTPTLRKIIHVDMDAFFASVEQRDNPELRGKPVAVGGSRERGVVAAASYEARKWGVRSAMPSAHAYRLCPHLIFVKPRFEAYKAVSRQIRRIFLDYTPLVEPLSLDEAYLDVTTPLMGPPSATLIAREIKRRIFEETGLTASAGISYNKFLAKVASDVQKPNGLTLVKPEEALDFIYQLPIERFYGIGKVTAEKMHSLGIRSGADLRDWPEEKLIRLFGKSGRYYYKLVQGIDERPVTPDRVRKSVGAETTFSHNLLRLEAMQGELEAIAEEVARDLDRLNQKGRTLTLKVKFSDFVQITRSTTLPQPIWQAPELHRLGCELLEGVDLEEKEVRLLGLTVSNLGEPPGGGQLSIPF
ncbi:DNA polymerase IV [Cesiribacter andamanensis]|uniref:DNA polymerase IV n=1 Tax=Cesiribacter andamanensis AMV16 TaxID=1279009 RepID=M7NHR2_9BACT|nr:DNA polymerase IV [Cesiribacter andamanensis]EMR01335.1 DNA polymerase IV [Cesiribacter andamanensis AMV16]